MTERYYKVAAHVFVLQTDDDSLITSDELSQYSPFAIDASDVVNADVVFRLRLTNSLPAMDKPTEELRQDDEGQQIIAGHTSDGLPFFEFWLGGQRSSAMLTSPDYKEAIVATECHRQFGVNNAVMVMYALATAKLQTALFHSSVVSHGGRAFMFLGKSGTGKSTHSSLWLKYIDGTRLVNDDNPVVRVLTDSNGQYEARVYGSPWSGKTPCYRNVSYPVGAIVQLSQAPYNKIRRLRPLEAYASLVPSISGKRWDRQLADGLHQTEELLVSGVPVWHLECLPDEAAARLCQENVDSISTEI
jgi:hypothetical protein